LSDAGDPLSAFLEAEVRRGAMPGASWWVGNAAGALTFGFTGNAAIEPETIPLTTDTPFDLASLTKPLATALLATMLDLEGRIRLDTPLGSVLPRLRESPFERATLRDVAAHRAGLPSWIPLYLAGTSRDAYVGAVASCARQGPPGSTLYSDLGYILLGFALEEATGTPLDGLFDERIARPLGLARCGFAGRTGRFGDAASTELDRAYERTLAGPDAPGQRFGGAILRGQVHDGNAWGLGGIAGHAGLFGTAEDVAKIALSILDPTRLGLEAGALDVMLRPVAAGAGIRTLGFLCAQDTDSVRGILPDRCVGHSGFTGTSLWVDAARPRIYVLLTNRVHPRVPMEPFTETRRGFHRVALDL
jgi:CubicO group peptidase (beta-lactamase class C family)